MDSTKIKADSIFKGLYTNEDFKRELELIKILPSQQVLTEFDEQNLKEYYELELLAYEMWYIGSKVRVISKGADLVVRHGHKDILLDNRSPELERLLDNFDNRSNTMDVTATGTYFSNKNLSEPGIVLFTQPITDRTGKQFIDPISDLLNISYLPCHFPNYNFVRFELGKYLKHHMPYARDFKKKWGAKLEFVIAIITDTCLALLHDVIIERNVVVASNMYHQSYRIYDLNELIEAMAVNWEGIITYLDIKLNYDADEVNKAIDFMCLNKVGRAGIFLDNFGPLKFLIPNQISGKVYVDFSVIGNILYNLFMVYHYTTLDTRDYYWKRL